MADDPLAAYKQLLETRRRAAASTAATITDDIDTFDPVPDETIASATSLPSVSELETTASLSSSHDPPPPVIHDGWTKLPVHIQRARSLDDDDDDSNDDHDHDADNDIKLGSHDRVRHVGDNNDRTARAKRLAAVAAAAAERRSGGGIDVIMDEVKYAPSHAPSIELDDNMLTPLHASLLAPLLATRLAAGLRSINAERNELGDDGVTTLCDAWIIAPYLVHVSFNYNQISDDGMIAIGRLASRCRGLTLKLMYNDIHDDGIKCLSTAIAQQRIWALALNGNELGCGGGISLATMMLPSGNGIVRLNVTGNGLERHGGIAIGMALAKNNILHALSMVDNSIGDDGVTAIANSLSSNDSLKLRTLKLSSNNIGAAGARALFTALHQRTKRANAAILANNEAAAVTMDGSVTSTATPQVVPVLVRRLALADNPITWRGVRPIHDFLAIDSSMVELNLTGCILGDKGVTLIAAALAKNRGLRGLRLYCNNIGDDGATSLAAALWTNERLQTLVLGDNMIGDIGATRLAESLRVNKTLSTLMMAENVAIGVVGSHELCMTMVHHNHTLTSLDITGSIVKPHTIAELREAMHRNIRRIQQHQRVLFLLALHRHTNPTAVMRSSLAPYTPICPYPVMEPPTAAAGTYDDGRGKVSTIHDGYGFSSNPSSFYHSPYSPPTRCAITHVFGASPIFDPHCLAMIFEFAAFGRLLVGR